MNRLTGYPVIGAFVALDTAFLGRPRHCSKPSPIVSQPHYETNLLAFPFLNSSISF
jgi:hypothetical protein